MKFNNVEAAPLSKASSPLVKLLGLIGGSGMYVAANSLYNVEGGLKWLC